jgi:cobalt-zinc-cadmium efflux system outer membrane protein
MTCLTAVKAKAALPSSNTLSLQDAIELALEKNPELSVFSIEIKASEAREFQEGLGPNPELDFSVEQIGGTGELNGFDAAEYSLGLSQTFELGGKRLKRKKVAFHEKTLADWDYQSKRLDIVADTTKAFAEVLGAQERLALVGESYELAGKVLKVVVELVDVGKVSPLEKTRAEVELSTIGIELEKAKRELAAARKRLASMWGSEAPAFEKAAGDISIMPGIPGFESSLAGISNNPDAARWDTEIELQRSIEAREKSIGVSDLTVSGGMLRASETDSTTYAIGLSMPLPLYNRNQGSALAARHTVDKTLAEKQSFYIQIESELNSIHQSLSAAHSEANTLKNDVMPAALKAFNATEEGYRYGKFDFLDVLDAQRTLVEVRLQYVDALLSYHSLLADFNRLCGSQFFSGTETLEHNNQGGSK